MDRDAATWAYRYLRLGMLGSVLLLGISLLIEIVDDDCVRGSISAYYHSPVRTVFVGVLLVIGFALVAYQGRSGLEDLFLNMAGMLAPFVAFVPTTSRGCGDEDLTAIDSAAMHNNVTAYLIAGAIGVVVGLVLVFREAEGSGLVDRASSTLVFPWIGNLAVVLVMGGLYVDWYDDFDVHGRSAVVMFVFLIVAVTCKAVERRNERDHWFWAYTVVAALMTLGGVVLAFFGDWDHQVFALEAWEIGLFGAFWLARTVQNWSGEPPRAPLEDRPVLPTAV
jgi:hypothetical protein